MFLTMQPVRQTKFQIMLALLAAALPLAAAAVQLEKLQPHGHVSDFADVFEAGSRESLANFLLDVKSATGAEIAVVTLPTLAGEEINDFANRLFVKWGIGRKGKDDGVLLLMALQERRVRIEVGYGLEPILPDARSGRILDETVIPRFKERQYAAGLADGAAAIAAIIAGQQGITLTGAPPRGITATNLTDPASAEPDQIGGGGIVVIVLFCVIIITLIVLGKRKGGQFGGFSSGGGFSGGSSSGGGFGGGSSGGGGASRGW